MNILKANALVCAVNTNYSTNITSNEVQPSMYSNGHRKGAPKML